MIATATGINTGNPGQKCMAKKVKGKGKIPQPERQDPVGAERLAPTTQAIKEWDRQEASDLFTLLTQLERECAYLGISSAVALTDLEIPTATPPKDADLTTLVACDYNGLAVVRTAAGYAIRPVESTKLAVTETQIGKEYLANMRAIEANLYTEKLSVLFTPTQRKALIDAAVQDGLRKEGTWIREIVLRELRAKGYKVEE